MNDQLQGETAHEHQNSPDAVAGDDHEVVVPAEGQNFDVGH